MILCKHICILYIYIYIFIYAHISAIPWNTESLENSSSLVRSHSRYIYIYIYVTAIISNKDSLENSLNFLRSHPYVHIQQNTYMYSTSISISLYIDINTER